jgi:aminoglycoside phosphotransferase (APT) family kinase protein
MGLIGTDKKRRLGAWLARQFSAGRVHIERLSPLDGGAISTNLAMDVTVDGGPLSGPQALVLRADSAARVSASLTKSEEFAVLRRAFQARMTVPEPLALCTDPELLGRQFYIMRRASGVAAGHLVVRSEQPQTDLARELGRQLGVLHGIRPGAEDLAFLPMPEPTPALAMVKRTRIWLEELDIKDTVLAWGLRWLELNAPPRGEIVLGHWDYRTGNYLVDNGRLTAILDWEFAGWADPMVDLAWFCSRSWRFGRRDREAGGIADRSHFYAGYQETSDIPLDHERIAYWEAAGYVRWSVIALQQADRHVSGADPSLELALTGRMVPEIEWDLVSYLQDLEKGAC